MTTGGLAALPAIVASRKALAMTHVFPGTEEEARDLAEATSRNCTHKGTYAGETCPAHDLLQPDSVKRLVFIRRRIRTHEEHEGKNR